MNESPRRRLAVYGLALLAPAITLLARWPLGTMLGDRVLYMVFFPAILIVAYFGGFWPGLVATVASALAATCLLVSPFSTLEFTGVRNTTALVLLVLVGAIISGVSESLRRARRRVEDHERRRDEEAQRESEERLRAAERRRAEEALHESEERFRGTFENAAVGIIHCDTEGRFLRVNQRYCDIVGFSREELLGMDIKDVTYPEDMALTHDKFTALVRGDLTCYSEDKRDIRKDGAVIWINIYVSLQRDRLGAPLHIIGIVQDISNRKRLEEALRESEERWRSLTEALPQLVWSATPDGACDYFSTQWTDHTGVAEAELLGWRWLQTLHPEDRERTRQLWLESVAERHPYDVEYRVRRTDGEYRWYKTRGVPIRDGGGTIIKWFGTCTDITDLRQTEEELRQSEERFRGLMEQAPFSVQVCAPDGRTVRVNRAWEELWGVTLDQLADYNILHDPQLEAKGASPYIMRAFAGEAVTISALEYDPEDTLPDRTRHENSRRWVAAVAYPLKDQQGRIREVVLIHQNITDRIRAEEALREAKESAEAANRAKDEFLANVSHEIRTPMNAILGMTELALETPLSEDQRQSLRTVKSAAENLLGIINDLLDFSKIEAGKLELDPADFSLRAALGDTLRALAVRSPQEGTGTGLSCLPDVPDFLVGDAGRLRQVLLNLVGNAIKFTAKGEVVVRAEVAEGPPTDPEVALRFSVCDTGIGIPQDKQERIFRAFEQEDNSTTRRYGGTGLGLSIAARLVTLMRGTITVESEPGRGSTFAFTARFARQPQPTEPSAVRPPVPLVDLPVLIVDDNATNRRILEEWLGNWRMEPVAVSDGATAMETLCDAVARGHSYPLVLLDARMPDMDGLTLASQILRRAELSATRIILLTSGDHPNDLARFRELRLDAHLLKPVQQDELLETIYRVMGRVNENELPATGPSRGRQSAPAAVPLRILVAEDNEFNSQLLEQLLVRSGHNVRLANNGRESLTLLEEGVFDLLLLDIHMPELDGFQVVQAVRERERIAGGHLPVIALTARSRKEDREQCFAAGMDDFLTKPIQAAELWAAIDRVVGSRGPAERSEPGLLNPHVLLAACGGDAVILETICQAFRARLPDHLTAVQDALRERDTIRLREAAHKLCGMVAAFSSVAGGVASDLEDIAAQSRLEEARPLVGQLETMADELMRLASGLSLKTLQEHAGPAGLAPGSNPQPIQPL